MFQHAAKSIRLPLLTEPAPVGRGIAVTLNRRQMICCACATSGAAVFANEGEEEPTARAAVRDAFRTDYSSLVTPGVKTGYVPSACGQTGGSLLSCNSSGRGA